MRYVKYVGLAHQRILSATDWRQAGLPGETVVWNAGNGFSVPVDRFTEDQLRKAIDPDPSFIITGDTPVVQVRDMVPAEAAEAAKATTPPIVLDATDGEGSTDDLGPFSEPSDGR